MSGAFLAASLTLSALVNGLSDGGPKADSARSFIDGEVRQLLKKNDINKLAPPVWFDCISQVHESRVLEREVLRRAGAVSPDGKMPASRLVRDIALGMCEDELHEN